MLVGTGCPSPDPEAKYDDFLEETKEERDDAANIKLDVSGALADISGTHLFALAASISPATPLQFIATVTMETTAEGAVATIDFQPLTLDVGATTEPREFVGDPLNFVDITFGAAGNFMLDMGEVGVDGTANPITGAEIVATLQLDGAIKTTDLWCGTAGGEVTVPALIPLMGSTFAAVRIDGTDPASLPTDVLSACPAEGAGSGGADETTGGGAATDGGVGSSTSG